MAKRRRKTRTRGAGGKFTRARRATTAIVVQAPRAPARRRRAPTVTVRRAAPVRRRRRSSGLLGGGGSGFAGSLKARSAALGASAAYAWIMNGDANTTPGKIRGYLDKVPVVAAIGRHATLGIIAALVAAKTTGRVRQGADLLATAALHRAAWNLGAAQFSIEKAAAMSGYDGDNELSGYIDDEEGVGYEDVGDDGSG